MKIQNISINNIVRNEDQPRNNFIGIEELAQSIKDMGLLEPVMVRPVNGKYQIIHGERRFRAASLAGLKNIPSIVRDASDKEVFQMAVVENIQRENLTPMEEARAFERLQADGMTQEQISKLIGKGQSYVAQKLRLLKMPDFLKHYIQLMEVSENHIRQILKLKNLYPRNLKSDMNFKDWPDLPREKAFVVYFLCCIRPEQYPVVFHLPVNNTTIEGTNIFMNYVSKHIPEQWEVAAFWWVNLAVHVSVVDLSIAIDRWFKRYASALLRVVCASKPAKWSESYAGWIADLRCSSSDSLSKNQVPVDLIIPIIKAGKIFNPSSMLPQAEQWKVAAGYQ